MNSEALKGIDELRARLTGPAVIEALGIDPADPRCPRCRSRIEIDTTTYSTSLRCTRERCRLGRIGCVWADHFAADLWWTETQEEARSRLLAAIGEAERVERETERAVKRFRMVAGIAS